MGYLPRRLGALVPIAVAPIAWAALMAACGGEISTNYGPPEGLAGKSINPPTPQGGGTDSGATPPTTDSGTPSTTDGGVAGTQCDSGPTTCAKSWTNDVYPLLKSTSTYACASGGTCHGGGTQAPSIPDNNPTGAYASLAAYNEVDLNPPFLDFITPCATQTAQSTFLCVVSYPVCAATTTQMPPAANGYAAVSATDLATITTWINCGSPLN